MSEQSKKLKQIDSVSNDNQPSTNQLNANPHQISHHVNTKQIQKQNKHKTKTLSHYVLPSKCMQKPRLNVSAKEDGRSPTGQ